MYKYDKLRPILPVLALWSSLLPYLASGQIKPTPFFLLQGKLPQAGKGKVCLLDKDNKSLYTAPIKGAQFTLRGSLLEPGLYQLQINHSAKKYPIFLDNLPIRVIFQAGGSYQVTGSVLHHQWEQYSQHVQLIKQQLVELYQARDTARLTGDTLLLNKLTRQNDSVSRGYHTYLRDQIAQQPYSYFNLFLLKKANLGEPYTTTMLNEFRPYLAHYSTFQRVGKRTTPLEVTHREKLLGQKAYDFSLPDSSGVKYSLDELRKRGKLILLDFWASWCRPCLEQLPLLRTLQERFEARGLMIVSISIDSDVQRWHKALTRYKPVGIQLLSSDKSPLLLRYGIDSIPHVVLIDSSGRIQGSDLVGDELSWKVMELLPKSP